MALCPCRSASNANSRSVLLPIMMIREPRSTNMLKRPGGSFVLLIVFKCVHDVSTCDLSMHA
eukprot:9483162-Lingulodinium_polyedra.AAC.1